MKLYFSTLLLLSMLAITSLSSTNSYAGNPHVDAAMKLYKSMEVNKSASLLIRNIGTNSSLDSIETLKYSLILNKNYSMYRDVYVKSVENQRVFLESLVDDKGKDRSKVASLFLTEVYIHQKEFQLAKKQLNEFRKTTGVSDSNKDELSIISNIYEAWIALATNDIQQYNKVSALMDKHNPLTLMALDALQIIVNNKSDIDLNVIKTAEGKYIENNALISSRFANYAIRIYSHRGELEQAIRIMNILDQKTPSYIEEITQFKLINFYEPGLIDSVSSFYYTLSKSLLLRLKADAKYKDMAIYYLSDLELISANKDSAKQYKEEMLQLKRLPKTLASLLSIRQNGHGYLYGKTTRAYQEWEKAVKNAKNDPALGAEAILMCVYLDANCPTIVQVAGLKAENGRSKRFEDLNTNVGRYFLQKKETIKAMRLLENALDRGDAGGILMNDPVLLLNLAEIYRINKRFSESLQIYFSLGKNFPILRQVQDAVQGEYLFRQRSIGSSIVF
ncbi:MAG: hypothetical protein OEX07_08865 [Gammaproteobacteria bacterium]|nr:hypothetical protein [Gammaproteobacteria bacterium]